MYRGHKLCGENDGRVPFDRDFRHRLEGAELKCHGILRVMMSAAWPSFTAAWYSPSAAMIFARRSRSASASFAIARCIFSGSTLHIFGQYNVFNLDRRYLCAPRLRVPVDHILDLQVDARGVREKLIEAKSPDDIAPSRLVADLIDRIVDILNHDHRFRSEI